MSLLSESREFHLPGIFLALLVGGMAADAGITEIAEGGGEEVVEDDEGEAVEDDEGAGLDEVEAQASVLLLE